MPSERRGSEIGDSEDVEGAGQHNSGNTVERRGNPGDLWAVDGKVGRHRSCQTLLCEDLGALVLGGMLGGCESVYLRELCCRTLRRAAMPLRMMLS